jgi:hypothetical protein
MTAVILVMFFNGFMWSSFRLCLMHFWSFLCSHMVCLLLHYTLLSRSLKWAAG